MAVFATATTSTLTTIPNTTNNASLSSTKKPAFQLKLPAFRPTSLITSSSLCNKLALDNVSENITTVLYGRRKALEIGVIGLMATSTILLGFPSQADATRIEYYATTAEPSCEMSVVKSGLAYCDLVIGSGDPAPYNTLINVHYTARFADERVFDSSYKRGRPLTMRIGVGKVIRGLDQGIFGGDGVPPMQVGGRRKLKIPPELAYGPEPAGCFSGDCNIPANATLLYDINFVGVYSGNRPLGK